MKKVKLTIVILLVITMIFTSTSIPVLSLTQREQEDIYRVSLYQNTVMKNYVDALLHSDTYCYHLAAKENSFLYSIFSLDSEKEVKEIIASLLTISADEIYQESKICVYSKLLSSLFDGFSKYISITTYPERNISKMQSVIKQVSEYYLHEFDIKTNIRLDNGKIDYDNILAQLEKKCNEVGDTVGTNLMKEFEAFRNSSEWLKSVKSVTTVASISTKVFDIASQSFSMLAEIESYELTDEKIIDLLFMIAYSTSNDLIKSTALNIRHKLLNSYEDNLKDGILEIIDNNVFDLVAGAIDDFLIGRFGLTGTMAKLGIECGKVVSDLWFNTSETISLSKSIWCIDHISEIVAALAEARLNNMSNYTSDSVYKAKTASEAIYYLRVLAALREQGEQCYYNLKMSSYQSDMIVMIRTLDFMDWTSLDSDVETIDAWYIQVRLMLDEIKTVLFRTIQPSEYSQEYVSGNRIATEFSESIPDGIYTIRNAESGLMMNVYAGTNADETNVVTWKYDGTTDQRFYIQHVENGQYIIYAVCSGNGDGTFSRCLDIYTGGTNVLPNSGDNVDIYKRSSSWNKCQLFYIVELEDGTVLFESCAVPGLVISAQNPNKDNGNINMEYYSANDSQSWYICGISGIREDADPYENDHINTGDYSVDLVNVAQTQCGYIELDVTTGSPLIDGNGIWYTKYGARFNDSSGAWCAYFVMWCAEQAGIPTSVIPQARTYGNCGALVNWFKNKGLWQDASYYPGSGDIVFFDWDGDNEADHVGIVEEVNPAGSINTIEGNAYNGVFYMVTEPTRNEHILGYGTPYIEFESFANSMIIDGGKKKGVAYMLPDAASNQVWYVDTNDRCIILCEDGDYYLMFYPFLNTGKFVIAYVPRDITVQYEWVPDADEYYSINIDVVLQQKTIAYHNPSSEKLMNGSIDAKVRTTWQKGQIVTVLFQYHDYYFVRTDKQSGFVPVEKVDLTKTPDVPVEIEEPISTTDPLETGQESDPYPITDDPEEMQLPIGDVDGDGIISEHDAIIILQYAAKLISPDKYQLKRADADQNGTVNVADASFLFVQIRNKTNTKEN